MNIKKVIRKYSLQNAIFYKGKANPGNIIGKVIGDYPSYRTKAKELAKDISTAVKEINKISLDEQKKELEALAPELLEKKKGEKKELKPLENAKKGKVIMRFEPSPSGPMHIGHAYPLLLNSEYCKIYDGKLILRISDTNPDNIDPQCYKLLEEDANWVTKGNIHEVVVQSDRMEIYYKYALQLIEEGHGYVCSCPAEEFREGIKKKVACPCRDLGQKEQLKRWKGMLNDTQEGKAVVRLKTDVNHKNPAMRDFPLLRINDTEHPRQGRKYRVWPLLNFAVAIDDHDLGLTHVLRGKDHYDNTKRQMYIYKYLKWEPPIFLHIGRINFEGLRLSASETRQAIEKKQYTGWNDIRLPFLQALRKRGYQPEAFAKYSKSVGVTMTDKTVQGNEFFKTLNTFNREVIGDKANRYFFIENPKEVKIEKAPEQEVELHLHPEKKKGGRKFKTKDKFYLSQEDLDDIKKMKDGSLVRLMDCLNFTKKGKKFIFHSTDYEYYKVDGKKIIHWLPAQKNDGLINVEIITPEEEIKIGLGEPLVGKLKKGDIIQFERFAFCKLNEIGKDKHWFWYAHK